jgi:chaperone required for assembly of F1-ATPase
MLGTSIYLSSRKWVALRLFQSRTYSKQLSDFESITPPSTCFDFSVVKQTCGKYALAVLGQYNNPAIKVSDASGPKHKQKYVQCPTSQNTLLFQNEILAWIAALEWNTTPLMKDTRHSRPCTNLYFRADFLDLDKGACIEKLCSFLSTDLLLHWEVDGSLSKRMQKEWQPILNKLEKNISDASAKEPGHSKISIDKYYNYGISTESQKSDNNHNIRSMLRSDLQRMNGLDLAMIELLSEEYTSILLAWGVFHGWINVDEAIESALLEVRHQTGQWGITDPMHIIEKNRLEQSSRLVLLVKAAIDTGSITI